MKSDRERTAAMARIDYSNVSISLRQFEEVASGKCNAGENGP